MKHRSSQGLFAHWDAMRLGRDCPERGDISPGALSLALGDVFILAFDVAGGHPFRLAGTRVCALFGKELRGHAFTRLWSDADRPRLAGLVDILADEAIGAVAGATGLNEQGDKVDLELTLLPLRHNGHTHQRLIGALAASSLPYWVGLRPLQHLVLGGERFLEARTATPAPVLKLPAARTKRGLAVYDGGRQS